MFLSKKHKRIIPPPPPLWKSWELLMQEALTEAKKAKELNEVPIGAVVVCPEGEIIGKGHNLSIKNNDPTAHAEIIAIREAGKKFKNYRLDKCHLIVSLEPCLMCAAAIVHARLAGLVFGAYDPKAGALSSCIDAFDLNFLNHSPWHLGGICEKECSELLQDFFTSKRL